jgi:uncharacterized protein YjbI with pentapeptide repeats
MSDMLIPKTDQPSLYDERPPDSLSSVARARTLTVLPRLDEDRKARVVQFLHESGLIVAGRPILDLQEADLREASLNEADLSGADLSEAYLNGAYLNWADLNGVNLRGANLRGANLHGAYLTRADLDQAKASEEQLEEASSLEGATMPNGQKYEEWLKSREEDG